jgi:hypothetical protein
MTTHAKAKATSRGVRNIRKTHKSQRELKVALRLDSAGALSTTSHSVPKLPKKCTSPVPAPQAERIKQMFVQGYSIRRISREEGRARQTIVRIVRSEDVQSFIKQMQEELWGLIPAAMGTLRHELETNRNSQLAYQMIKYIGIFLPAKIQPQISPYDSDERVKQIMAEFVKIGLERNRIYGTPFPEIEAAAARAGVKIQLRSAALDDDDEDINEMHVPQHNS